MGSCVILHKIIVVRKIFINKLVNEVGGEKREVLIEQLFF